MGFVTHWLGFWNHRIIEPKMAAHHRMARLYNPRIIKLCISKHPNLMVFQNPGIFKPQASVNTSAYQSYPVIIQSQDSMMSAYQNAEPFKSRELIIPKSWHPKSIIFILSSYNPKITESHAYRIYNLLHAADIIRVISIPGLEHHRVSESFTHRELSNATPTESWDSIILWLYNL